MQHAYSSKRSNEHARHARIGRLAARRNASAALPNACYWNEKCRSIGVDQFIHSVGDVAATGLRAVEIRIRGGRFEVAVRRAVGSVDRVHNL